MRISNVQVRCLVVFAAIFHATLVIADGTNVNDGVVKLAGSRLQLEEHDQICHVINLSSTKKSQMYSLEIPWPCNFHKNRSGEVRIIRNGKYEYLLVEASTPVPDSHDCETHLRAIRATGKKAYISEYKDKVASCPPFQWDKLVFTELFR